MPTRSEEAGMPVVVKGKNVEVMPALRQVAVRKVARLARYFNSHDAVRAEVALGLLRGQYTAEVTLQLGGVFVRGVGKAPEAQAAIDDAVDKAERQFLRFKSRLEPAKTPATVRSAGGGEGEQAPGKKAEVAAGAGEEGSPRLVRVKRFALKPMSTDEAVLQMEMLGHDFFVFTNAATDEVNVLYRRRDGNYGLIEPDG
ncbi:MAG: ribosome-associated translation inhibitor RaiA [Bacillota bacterium]